MSTNVFTCRWAALSLSNIAAVFLPDILLPRNESEAIVHKLVAVSTTSGSERATSWLKEHKIEGAADVKIYHSWEEMLEAGDFDVVYISTPHPLHYKHVQKALECKRNVLVEKPATMTRPQYESLVGLAIQQNVVLMEAMWVSSSVESVYPEVAIADLDLDTISASDKVPARRTPAKDWSGQTSLH